MQLLFIANKEAPLKRPQAGHHRHCLSLSLVIEIDKATVHSLIELKS